MSSAAALEYTHGMLAEIAQAGRTFEAWRNRGRALAKADSARQWEIGDWLLAGKEKLGPAKAYGEALAIFQGYQRATLKDFAHVARRVTPSVRTNDLSWAHHKLVARFPNPEYQQGLLSKAVERNWPLAAFRAYINREYPPKQPKALDRDGRYQKLYSFVGSLYGKLPPAQRREEIRRHARRLIRDFSKAEAKTI